MFDYLFIDTNLLPITKEEKELIGENHEFQTKDFDRELTEIYITNEGEVKVNRFEMEEVPKEERPYMNEVGIFNLFGSIRRVNERLETINHHGYVRFYTNVGETWFEFSAKFTDGKMVNIERVIDEQDI